MKINETAKYLNWRKRNTKPPLKNIKSVFRYMDTIYIKHFFETGELKLSTYQGNRTIEDLSRKDSEEGREFIRYFNKKRDYYTDFEIGPAPFGWLTYCTSTEYNPEKFFKKFNTNGCFEITNTTGFGIEIAKVLKNFHSGMESPVLYSDNRSFNVFLEKYPHISDFDKNSNSLEIVRNVANLKINDFELFFRKRIIFSSENEYRHVWRVINKNQSEFIHCPGALSYCKIIP